jgi:hypothetical protein
MDSLTIFELFYAEGTDSLIIEESCGIESSLI